MKTRQTTRGALETSYQFMCHKSYSIGFLTHCSERAYVCTYTDWKGQPGDKLQHEILLTCVTVLAAFLERGSVEGKFLIIHSHERM